MLSNRPIAIPDEMIGGPGKARQPRPTDWFNREMAAIRFRAKREAVSAEWDRKLREGDCLVRSFGGKNLNPTLDQEAEEWLQLFDRLGCSLDLSPYSHSLGYKIPPDAQQSGEAWPLISWLDAAEARIPGITARVIERAFNYDAIEAVLVRARQTAADAQRKRAETRAAARQTMQEART